jgi:hypothetical protein
MLEKGLSATEFVVLPIFGRAGQPEYPIEIDIRRPDALTLDELNTALASTNVAYRLASIRPRVSLCPRTVSRG